MALKRLLIPKGKTDQQMPKENTSYTVGAAQSKTEATEDERNRRTRHD